MIEWFLATEDRSVDAWKLPTQETFLSIQNTVDITGLVETLVSIYILSVAAYFVKETDTDRASQS